MASKTRPYKAVAAGRDREPALVAHHLLHFAGGQAAGPAPRGYFVIASLAYEFLHSAAIKENDTQLTRIEFQRISRGLYACQNKYRPFRHTSEYDDRDDSVLTCGHDYA
ncbi:hypothetical protein EVAR_46251_1 [Eumeta japonica]|uniref:Uncharacterized protein n=1 Tax=Eumeta variegata TaxID=151549 RepID=A0A4C1Y6C4_EUMVA|nr:hypothetical protein EVAR_46251_1 [Eumeta japonica]